MGIYSTLRLWPARPSPVQVAPPDAQGQLSGDGKLTATVIFTSDEVTEAAVEYAGRLLEGLNGHISLLHIEMVPYPLALERPLVSVEFMKRRLRAVGKKIPVDCTANVHLCRRRLETLMSVLKSESLVVMGCRKRWWPGWEKKLAAKLQRAGHHVVLLEVASSSRLPRRSHIVLH